MKSALSVAALLLGCSSAWEMCPGIGCPDYTPDRLCMFECIDPSGATYFDGWCGGVQLGTCQYAIDNHLACFRPGSLMRWIPFETLVTCDLDACNTYINNAPGYGGHERAAGWIKGYDIIYGGLNVNSTASSFSNNSKVGAGSPGDQFAQFLTQNPGQASQVYTATNGNAPCSQASAPSGCSCAIKGSFMEQSICCNGPKVEDQTMNQKCTPTCPDPKQCDYPPSMAP